MSRYRQDKFGRQPEDALAFAKRAEQPALVTLIQLGVLFVGPFLIGDRENWLRVWLF